MLNKVNAKVHRRFLRPSPGPHDTCTLDRDSAMLMLGDAGWSILRAIAAGASDKWTVHLMTGLPEPCIDGRTRVLDRFNLIAMSGHGRLVPTPCGKALLDGW